MRERFTLLERIDIQLLAHSALNYGRAVLRGDLDGALTYGTALIDYQRELQVTVIHEHDIQAEWQRLSEIACEREGLLVATPVAA